MCGKSVNSESPPIFCSSPSRYIEVRRGRSSSDANDTKDTDGHTAKRRRSTSSTQHSSYPPPCNECDSTRRAESRSPLIKQTPTKPSYSVKCTLDSFDDQRQDVAPGWPRSTHTTDRNGRSLSLEIDPLVSIATSGAMERALLEDDREAPMSNKCQRSVSPEIPSHFAPAIWIWISIKRRNEELQSGGCKDATNINTREAFFEMLHRVLRRFMKNDERIAVAEVHQVKIDADSDLHIPGYPILNSCDDVGWEFLRFMSEHKEVARIMLAVIVTVECSEVNENNRDIFPKK